ncbi:SPASM domain-containing protein [Clostridium grantii]|uniref:Radical SAM superfamily enzyme, MoaA/NifB/PqqE/SkfB family n=1 Tax=Clostridium grantii DSM 8605 TaxID=1121316 RepID=A0A1M5TNP0_9CLOT|nr:SPASM domain-containing protein [Clostridium grantii]SHH52324.1 Radical SAM superfamily enzyme, MoaA/NifB/PqqE/SkfB family [Clostridium grantii DSM 8605]
MIELKKLYIEPTSNCNLHCEMCFRNTWFDEVFCDMKYELFEKILKNIPCETETIFFGGMGEPLHHPKIIDMILDCSNLDYKVELLTNGSLLSETMDKALMEAGVSKLWVSMDAIEPTDNSGMGHPFYENLIDKIKEFNKLRYKNNSLIQLGITFVATKSNVAQLAKLPYFIDQYNIDEVNISNMYPSSREAQKETLYQKTLNMSIGSDSFASSRSVVNLPFMDFDLSQVREGLSGLFSKMNFNLKISNNSVPRPSQYCRFVNEGMAFVRSDGNVSPCMALLHNGTTVIGDTERKVYHHSFGNVNDLGVKEIWESKDYVTFRKRVQEFSFSPCMNCGHCTYVEDNKSDCFGNEKPTCGACLWAEGLLSCP